MNQWNSHIFEGWFTISLPDLWEYEAEDVITFFSSEDGEGALQFSLFKRRKNIIGTEEFVNQQLIGFIKEHAIKNVKSKKIISSDCTVAFAEGTTDMDFIKIWTIANECKYILATYISHNKTNELSIVEKIIDSIRME